ncbi:acyl-CoA dehydrogenase family protein [Nocardioides sp. Arc9.136]|uniref:acyl-CoA dehydrogenase family protein n=1 Tax=Nocardioides sp. Arc9.136 TaxID=2996826 RepID=UPI0026668FAE|nr:acyl-CoA dehydrogenase family protein [Nocardioides sp. Arc9.136]WKN48470.1 acyl-CoA/acyl-ACP dehydrogenase [Nocardioides sp. Arc9.136]
MAPVAEHDELREVVRQVLAKHAGHEQVRSAAATERGWSEELWQLLNAELEVAGMAVPEERGGSGYGVRELAVLLEEAGGALLPEPLLASAVLGAQALAAADSADEHRPLLDALVAGRSVATVAPLRGPVALRAERDGEAWLVSGVLPRVLQAGAADHLVCRAASERGEVLVVTGLAAARVEQLTVVDPTRRQARVSLERSPAALVVGTARHDEVVERLALLADVAVAAEHAGIVAHLLEATCAYVVQREQFGRPIGSFQAVKHRLADLLVDLERSRSAVRYAAAAMDADPVSAALPVAVAAAVCADAAVRTAHEAVQLHGGIGFTWEHFAHDYLRRVLGDEGLFGASRAQRATVAELIGV